MNMSKRKEAAAKKLQEELVVKKREEFLGLVQAATKVTQQSIRAVITRYGPQLEVFTVENDEDQVAKG